MKPFLFLLLILFSSCGIEVVGYLENLPTIDFKSAENIQLSREGKIVYTIPSSYLLSNTGVLGFDIYYKILKEEATETINLETDNTTLNTTTDGLQPSVSKLKNLNYILGSVRPKNDTIKFPYNSPNPIISLEKLDYNLSYKLVLDFSEYINSPLNERSEIIPSVFLYKATDNINDPLAVPVLDLEFHRGVLLDNSFRKFGDLFDPVQAIKEKLEPNLTGNNVSILVQNEVLEICFFITSIGYDNLTFENLESTPIPLGIIKGLKIK